MQNRMIIIFCMILFIFTGCQTQKNNNPSITENTERLLGAYYFGAGYFTMVPENIRHDLDDMKSLGTDVICIGVTENDIDINLEYKYHGDFNEKSMFHKYFVFCSLEHKYTAWAVRKI